MGPIMGLLANAAVEKSSAATTVGNAIEKRRFFRKAVMVFLLDGNT
jgi:hypothetical protein